MCCLAVMLVSSQAMAQANLFAEAEKAIQKDSSKHHEFYIGAVGSALFGSGDIGQFDISSWQNTSGTRVDNNANLEARLRSTPAKFDGSAMGRGIVLGYTYKLTDRIALLAELPVATGQGSYSAALYGGLLYQVYQKDNFKVSAVAKLGYGQQVMRHTKLSTIQDSIPVSMGRTGSSNGMVYNDYGKVVFTRQGTYLDGDHLLLSLVGVQYQLGVVADLGLWKDRFVLKGQVAYQGAYTWLDKIVIDPNRSTRTDNNSRLPENPYELSPKNAAVVKSDLRNTQADLKMNALLHGVFVSMGLGIRF